MPARRGVFFMHLGNSIGRKAAGDTCQRRPKAAVNESDFSIYQSTNQYIFGVSYRLKDGKNLTAFRMPPPTTLYRTIYDCFSQAWHGAAGRGEDYSVLFDKREGFSGSHILTLKTMCENSNRQSIDDCP